MCCRLRWSAKIAIFLFLSSAVAFARIDSYGKEFWLCFQKNYRQQGGRPNLRLELFITAVREARVRIEIEELRFYREVQVPARSVVNVSIPPGAQIVSSEVKSRKAIHIVSDQPISVYGLNRRPQSTDTYLGLPVSALGTEYRVVAYTKLSRDYLSQFAIIATEDDTKVTIVPTAETRKRRPPGVPFTIELDRGEVYQVIAAYDIRSPSDLTGSYIRASKPVAVFSGHSCAYVPPLVQACNHLVEQIPPMSKWGKHFYVGKLAKRKRYTVRVVAAYPNTKVFENNRLVATLNAGEFYENSNVRDNILIASDRPVLVAQYAHGSDDLRDRIGDPMMILITPTQQFLPYYQFATPVRGTWRHYINLIVPRSALRSLRLDGKPVDTTIFQRIGVSRYYFAQLQVPYGTHIIQADEPFGMYSYGLGYGVDDYDAYGNVAGQSFEEVREVPDTLAPIAEEIEGDGSALIVLRDDRNNDWGLKSIRTLLFQGLRFTLPRIVEGVPQATFEVRPEVVGSYGFGQFEVEDRAGNKTVFTVCYTRDLLQNRFVFFVLSGTHQQCPSPSQWEAEAFIHYQQGLAQGKFPQIGDVTTKGYFTGRAISDWSAGAGIVYRWNYRIGIGVSIRLARPQHLLVAPDTFQSRVRMPDGRFVRLQEATALTFQGWILSWTAKVEWYWTAFLYALAGVQMDMVLDRSVIVERRILKPSGYVYDNGTNQLTVFEGSLETFQRTAFGGIVGIGARANVWRGWNVFGEAFLNYALTSMATDVEWKWHGLNLRVGVRHALFVP